MLKQLIKYYQKIGIYILIARKRKKLFISIEHYIAIILLFTNHIGYLTIFIFQIFKDMLELNYSKIYTNILFSIVILCTGISFYYFRRFMFNKRIILKLYKDNFNEPDPMGKAVLYGIIPNLIVVLIIFLLLYVFKGH